MYQTSTKNNKSVKFVSKALALLAFVMFAQISSFGQVTNPAPYCGANHNYMGSNGSCYNNYGFAFDRIEFAGMDHKIKCSSTSPSSGPYRFFNSGPTTTVSPGASYTVKVTSAVVNYYALWAAAWIDYNQDNTFQASENVMISSSIPYPNGTYQKTITIPCTAKPGKTRMRFRIDYVSQFNANQACGNSSYGYGETIDYEITIANAGNPSANFFIPDSVFSGADATFLNGNKVGYTAHAWSTSVGGLTNVVSTATDFPYAFPSAGNYQVRLTSTNCNGSATTTKNVTVIDPMYAPTVRFLASRNEINIPGNDPVVDEIVDFRDFSTGGPTGHLWEIYPDQSNKFWFEIAGSLSSKDVSIFFTDTAKYEICKTSSNAVGSNRLCKTNYVNIQYDESGDKYENVICTDMSSGLDSGVVYDPGGKDGNYKAQVYLCQFTINACDAEEIEMWFDGTMQLYYYGYVRLYDGPDNNGELIESFGLGGSGIYTTIPNKKFKAKSGKATVEFYNQYSYYQGQGFELYWKVKPKNDGGIVADFNVEGTRNDSIYSCLVGTTVGFKNKTHGSRDIDPDDYQWIFDYDPSISYPEGYSDNVFIANGNTVDPTYEYTNDKTYTVRLVAKSCEGYDTAYQTFYIGSTTMLPNVDFTTDNNVLNVGGSTILRNTTVAGCSGTWQINPTTYTLLNGTSLTDNVVEVKFNEVGRYTVKFTATNDNGSASRTRTDFIRVIDYCSPTIGYTSSGVSVNLVKFGNINNVTGIGNGYEDYTAISTDVVIGGTYALEVSRNEAFDLADRKVWIDFNRDGEFDNSEIVAQDNSTYAATLTANVTIPDINTVSPGATRMRVAAALAGGSFKSCGPIDAGEYEDYTIMLRTDDVAPVITLNGADSVYIEIGSTYTDAGATAMDNIEGDITGKMVTNNQVDMTQTGVYVVTYNVQDGSGVPAPQRVRFVFVVADLTKPVITLNGSSTVTHEAGTPYVDAGATATDNPGSKNVDNLIVVKNNVDVTKLGTYTVEYKVTDAYGNTATEIRTVEVKDTKAPVINIVGGDPMTIQVGSVFADPTTATDAFEGMVPVQVTSGAVNTSVFGGQFKVTYTAVDASGNVATPVTRTFNVTDMVPPVIASLSGTQYMVVDVNDLTFVEPPVTATDNYFPAVNVTRNAGGFDISKLGTYNVTYTATDAAGNVATWVRTIKVVDRQRPVVLSEPVNMMRWTAFNPKAGVSAYDNYYAPSDFINETNGCRIAIISNNVNPNAEGIYQVIYQAVDGSGNVSDPSMRIVNVTANTTGIADVFANSINVYPNPNSGRFDVEFASSVEPGTTITIMNIAGQTVKQFTANDMVNGKLTVDLDNAAAGVYFVQVQSNSQAAVKKVTVTR